MACALWRWLVLMACLGAAGSCGATQHALLVGVGQYPALPATLQLKAPANDVHLMRQVLLQRGWAAAHIEVLADGQDAAHLPTRAAIVAALRGLAARAQAGDTVFVHFSGHGSLQWASPPPPAGSQEPPTWQPVFLPRDVRALSGQSGPAVPNALADTVLRQLIDRINDTGAFVFAVFDACHSARLVRGALPGTEASQLRVRQVAPAALGLPGEPPPDGLPAWGSRPARAAPPGPTAERRGQAVYFYAAQSVELAAALPLSAGAEPAWHGLLSWHVAQALALGQPMSYRQLGQHVLSRYDRLPATTATPLFSGDGLDQLVFGQQTLLVRQWPLVRGQGWMSVPAGAFSGLAEGALLALLADPLAPPVAGGPTALPAGTLGFMRVATLQANRALLEPVAWQGWAAPSAAALPPGSWARLMVSPPSFALRVAIERAGCRAGCLAGKALARLQRDGVPGVQVRWVGPHEAPDARLLATDAGVRLMLPVAAESGEGSWGQAVPPGDEAQALDLLAQQTADALHRVARLRNLLSLAAALALRTPFEGVRLTLSLRRAAGGAEMPVLPEQFTTVSPGDALLLEGRNAGGDPVDLVAFWLGSDQSIRQIYPRDRRASPRLDAGASLRQRGWAIDAGSQGVERLLVLMVPMRPGQESSDFRFLEQSPLARLRGAGDPLLQALLDACFADHATRGDAAPAPPADRLGLLLYTFQVRP